MNCRHQVRQKSYEMVRANLFFVKHAVSLRFRMAHHAIIQYHERSSADSIRWIYLSEDVEKRIEFSDDWPRIYFLIKVIMGTPNFLLLYLRLSLILKIFYESFMSSCENDTLHQNWAQQMMSGKGFALENWWKKSLSILFTILIIISCNIFNNIECLRFISFLHVHNVHIMRIQFS